MNVLVAHQYTAASRHDGVIGVALQDGESSRREVVAGVIEFDDITLLARTLKQLGFLSALHVLMFSHNYARCLGRVRHRAAGENMVFSDMSRCAAP